MSGVYVHIPFCMRKCAYCDFVSFADQSRMQDYLNALRAEIALRGADERFQTQFDTVFIGGGTPSVLPLGAIAAIMQSLHSSFPIAADAEISMETNPGTLTADKLKAYADAGVNRLSVGLQSSDDKLLQRIGRIHTYTDFLHSYELICRAGFTNVNVDVMYGLPGQTPEDHEKTLRDVAALAPAHISAYSLILEEGTPLYAENPALPAEEDTYAMHRSTRERLSALGYARYEISNYAKPGFACRHNLNYWDTGAYLGLGLNAHSAWRMPGWTRFSNTSSLPSYLAAIAKNSLPADYTAIPQAEEMFEYVMLGTRKTAGLSLSAFAARFQTDFQMMYSKAIETLLARKWAVLENGRFYFSEEGLDLQNQALLLFMD